MGVTELQWLRTKERAEDWDETVGKDTQKQHPDPRSRRSLGFSDNRVTSAGGLQDPERKRSIAAKWRPDLGVPFGGVHQSEAGLAHA